MTISTLYFAGSSPIRFSFFFFNISNWNKLKSFNFNLIQIIERKLHTLYTYIYSLIVISPNKYAAFVYFVYVVPVERTSNYAISAQTWRSDFVRLDNI